ncbi:TPA: cell division protein FtsK [Candidatus Uhrbacteria bacterium]|nr:cell division protein FtsK [Candidatus Uhrbacteria bacterium]
MIAMARKRKRKQGGSHRSHSGLSDGVKQSIFAICLIALAVFFLLSFFDLSGTIGLAADGMLAKLFGWDRWLFSLILVVISWHILFPSRGIFSWINYLGIALFFIAFNGLLNLFLLDDVFTISDLAVAGGYIGMLVSELLVSVLGFWGSFVVVFAGLCIAIILVFDLSLQNVLTVPAHFAQLGQFMRKSKEQDDQVLYADDQSNEEDAEDQDDSEEFEEKKKKPVFDHPDDKEQESVMTSKQRRKVEIPLELLQEHGSDGKSGDIDRNQEIIRRTFENFGIDVEMVGVRVGPTVTQYALRPAEGVKLSRIVALHNDLALALAAHPIRIEAPIPGRSLVGIEVPNIKVGQVCLRELIDSDVFKHRKTNFTAPLGKDVSGTVNAVAVDKAPHMLVAGATGSGKSVCLNTIILSLLYQNGPDDLKLIMVDPKRVEMGVYAGIPHLLIPPITKVEEAINALKWAVREMERRLDHLAKQGTRDIDAYNAKCKDRMPKIVIIIDELADLMSQNKRDVEAVIVRISQMARAAGIHLVLATQRPSVDVITGLIKANIPTRIAFAVASQVDSKTILDQAGAEKLLGRGDMLLTTPQISKPKRLQGAFVSDDEIERVVSFLKKQGEPDYNHQITEDTRTGGTAFSADDSDSMLEEAIEIVIESGKASTSYLQRRLKIGYSRAARMIDLMEQLGVVSEGNGAKPRDVLVSQWPIHDDEPEDSYEKKHDNDSRSDQDDNKVIDDEATDEQQENENTEIDDDDDDDDQEFIGDLDDQVEDEQETRIIHDEF